MRVRPQCVSHAGVLWLLAAAVGCVSGEVSQRRASLVSSDPSTASKSALNALLVVDRHDAVKNAPRRAQAQKKFDPKRSWLRFVRRSERNDDRRFRKRKMKRTLRGPPGPASPPSNRGPPGSSAAAITIDVLMNRMSNKIKDIVIRETRAILGERTWNESTRLPGSESTWSLWGNESTTSLTPFPKYNDTSLLGSVPRLSVAFQCRLQSKLYVEWRGKVEVAPYEQGNSGGTFRRGDAFHLTDGRFYAPVSGVYQFAIAAVASVKCKRHRTSRRHTTLTVHICVQSKCTESVLRAATSIKYPRRISREEVVSLTRNGLLYLQKGQYVSVFVDNDTLCHVYLTSDSSFSGLLIGV